MKKLLLATRNRDKVSEITELLSGLDVTVHTLDGFPGAPEVAEDGQTLEENAVKKARTLHEFSGLPTIADDTGLEVDYLNGSPGVFSSRYAGEDASYEKNVRKLLADLKGVSKEKRRARFRCVVAFCDETRTRTFEGVCEGEILAEPKGHAGFGYDPVFLVPAYGLTFAEMPAAQKNRISHRGEAFRKLKAFLESYHGS